MELTVYWTQFTEEKLEDIFSYYREKASLKIAQKLINDIIDKSIELEKNPLIGQKEVLLENRAKEFRYLLCGNYKIIYWINLGKRRVDIINVFDCRQNPQRISEI